MVDRPHFDRALIAKYNRPGPRYTSYPTAVQFTPEVDRALLVADVAAGEGPLSLYLHLPFCESLCWFCACTTVITTNHGRADGYLDLLEREADLWARHLDGGRVVDQLHLGGGSPSFLSGEQLRRLGGILKGRFAFAEEAERSAELDPRTLTEDKVEALREAGFNRASFGVQDVNPEVQVAVHRVQPTEMNRRSLAWLRQAGFRSINVDLIYGLPRQTLTSFAATLDEVLSYEPERLAVFSYAHVPWVAPAQKILEQRERLPSPELKLDLLELIIARLTAAGYVYIGMDHFAKPTDELAVALREGKLHRNFQGYSTRAGRDLCGLGMSAISQTAASYRQNFKDLKVYAAALEEGNLPIERGYRLTEEDQRRRMLIMRVMCDLRVDFEEVSREFGLPARERYARELENLREMEADGLVEITDRELVVTPRGRLLVRNVAMAFDEHLRAGSVRHAKTV